MANPKEYRSVSEFPLQPQQLQREELEANYLDLRQEYKSLCYSRGQLLRRNGETKVKLQRLSESLQQKTAALERLNLERQQLQNSLQISLETRQELQAWGTTLEHELDDLKDQMYATSKLIEDFEEVYNETNDNKGVWSIATRLSRLLYAARKLLTTDIRDIVPKTLPDRSADEDWSKEDTASINRSLLDE